MVDSKHDALTGMTEGRAAAIDCDDWSYALKRCLRESDCVCATATRTIFPDPRIEAIARYLSQNVVSGTKERDPDDLVRGGAIRVWEAWEATARGCVAAAESVQLPRQHTRPVHALVQEALARKSRA